MMGTQHSQKALVFVSLSRDCKPVIKNRGLEKSRNSSYRMAMMLYITDFLDMIKALFLHPGLNMQHMQATATNLCGGGKSYCEHPSDYPLATILQVELTFQRLLILQRRRKTNVSENSYIS